MTATGSITVTRWTRLSIVTVTVAVGVVGYLALAFVFHPVAIGVPLVGV